MYNFKEEDNLKALDEFVITNGGSYFQTSLWTGTKAQWRSRSYCGFDENGNRVLSAPVVIKKLNLIGEFWYIFCGPLYDRRNKTLMSEFTAFLKTEMKKYGAAFTVINPEIPLRINGSKNDLGIDAHEELVSLGYKLNTKISTYRNNAPVSMILPLLDENNRAKAPVDILKDSDKTARNSVKLGISRGLVSHSFNYDSLLSNPQIMEDFTDVFNDKAFRKRMINRDSEYWMNFIKIFSDYCSITIVYYDKILDKKLELQRRDKRSLLVEELKTADSADAKRINDEIGIIDKNTAGYKARVEETKNYRDDAGIPVAAGISVHFGEKGTCIMGGSRELLISSTKSDYYLDYLRICDSITAHCDAYNMGGFRIKDPEIDEDGTLGEVIPSDKAKSTYNYMKSFGCSEYQYIGEYILVSRKFSKWVYYYVRPLYKKLCLFLKTLFKSKKKKKSKYEIN